MDVQPIGVIHSPVANPKDMPFEGVPARLELSPQFEDGLLGISGGTHVIVIGWMHLAGRGTLQLSRSRWEPDEHRGVFALRSSQRPNPLSITISKLERLDGRILFLDRSGLIDGTMIVDIKRYSPGWDCVFSARSSRDLRYQGQVDWQQVTDGMMVEAVNYHGERCVGVALGVRLMHYAMVEWLMPQKDPKLVVHLGENGCIADAVQGLSGATLGNGRMKVPGGRVFRLDYGGKRILAFHPKELPDGFGVGNVMCAEIGELFSIRSEVVAEGSSPHGGHRAKSYAPSKGKQAVLLDAVQEALVEGCLPCGVAHRLAESLGVSIADIGWAADAAKVRITKCQLGCFR